jgi:transposase
MHVGIILNSKIECAHCSEHVDAHNSHICLETEELLFTFLRTTFSSISNMILSKDQLREKRMVAKRRKMPYTSLGERQAIHLLHSLGKKNTEIAKLLGCSPKTCQRVLKAFRESGSFSPKPKSGRPRKVTPEKEAELIRLSEENRKRCAPELNALLKEQDASFDVANTSINFYLRKNGLFGRVCSRKPLLRPANKAARLAWALEHRDKPLDFWKKVLWTDEKKFELFIPSSWSGKRWIAEY